MTEATHVTAAKADPYGPWRNRAYRRYCASWFLVVFSKEIETIAVGIFLYGETRDPLSLGWVGLARALPVMLLAMAGGTIADRFDRRNVLLVTLTMSTLVATGLLLAVSTGASALWLYALLALGAVTQAIGAPSRAALLPQLVEVETFSTAMTWNSTIFQTATMTGPALGGLVIGRGNHAVAAFAVVVACRLLALLATAGIPPHPRTGARSESITLESLAAGIRFVWTTKPILATITLDLFAVLFGGLTYLLPVFAIDILGGSADTAGFLRSAEAVGAVSMAVLLAHLPPIRRAGLTMLLAVAGFGAATITFGLSQWFWLSLVAMFLIGALDNISVVVRHTLVQVLTPDAMRGRVSAVNGIFITTSNDLGGFESGLTAWLFGPVVSVVGGGICTILVVLSATRLWPQLLRLGSLSEIRPAGPPVDALEELDQETLP